MSYQVQFHTCKDRIAAMNPTLGEESDVFATYADRLLLGQDLKVDIPQAVKGEHIDQVMLVYDKAVVCSVYLMCTCTAVATNERATSALLTPQKKLLLPR